MMGKKVEVSALTALVGSMAAQVKPNANTESQIADLMASNAGPISEFIAAEIRAALK
jgi:hypothetical protein